MGVILEVTSEKLPKMNVLVHLIPIYILSLVAVRSGSLRCLCALAAAIGEWRGAPYCGLGTLYTWLDVVELQLS